jgi:D-sorbitol dehydrogenase (acceptor)
VSCRLLRQQGRVICFARCLVLELIKHSIYVNAIDPGFVDTPMWDQVDALLAKDEDRPVGKKRRLVGETVPLGRKGPPEDVTGAAIVLASPDIGHVLAQTRNVDGGIWMS